MADVGIPAAVCKPKEKSVDMNTNANSIRGGFNKWLCGKRNTPSPEFARELELAYMEGYMQSCKDEGSYYSSYE